MAIVTLLSFGESKPHDPSISRGEEIPSKQQLYLAQGGKFLLFLIFGRVCVTMACFLDCSGCYLFCSLVDLFIVFENYVYCMEAAVLIPFPFLLLFSGGSLGWLSLLSI